MPFETPSLPVLVSRTQIDLGIDALRRSDSQVLGRTLAGAAFGLYGYIDWIVDQILPDRADEETLERAAALRLARPRKAAQPASGTASFTAVAGAVLDADVVLQAGDGRAFRVTTGVIAIEGLNTAAIEAVDAGVAGNAAPGVVLQLVQPAAGITSTFTVKSPGLTGGIAQESIESLRARVILSYRVIPHVGSAEDYEAWALEVAGVTRAWCRRNYLGPGTVGVFVMRDGDANPVPTPAQLAEVQTHIESSRPVTAELYVWAPSRQQVFYSIHLVPDTGAVRASVQARLIDLHDREAGLGETLLLTHIAEAISGAGGETDHKLIAPVADVVAGASQLLTFGGITWL